MATKGKYSKRFKKIKRKIFKTKKEIFWVNFLFITFFGLLVFLPPIYAEAVARQDFEDINEQNSGLAESSFWKYLWEPQYIIMADDVENEQLGVNYITLRRKNLIWWEVNRDESNSFILNGITSEDLSDEGLKTVFEGAEENAEELEEFNEQAVQISEEGYKPGTVLNDLDDPNDKNDVKLLVGASPEDNEVEVNREKFDVLKNVSNLHFDLEGSYLYYSKYTTDPNDEVDDIFYSGKIFRWDLNKKSEEELYDFKRSVFISFRANQSKIAYALIDKEVGVIDIGTKKVFLVDPVSLPEVSSGLGVEVEFIPILVTDIGPETAMYEVNNGTEEGDYFRLNLESLEVAKE